MLYCYSNTEERFSHTVESSTSLPVVEAARREYPGERVCIGIVADLDAAAFVRGEDILDILQYVAHEQVDEYADGWLERVSPEECQLLETKIQDVVRDWIRQTGNRLNARVIRDVEWYEP